jgi:hypothetical protein
VLYDTESRYYHAGMKKNVSLLREDWDRLRVLWLRGPEAGRTQEQAFEELAGIINGLAGSDLLDALLFRSHTVEMPEELVNALEAGRMRFAAEVQAQGITTRQQTSEKALLLLAARMLARRAGPAGAATTAPLQRLADNTRKISGKETPGDSDRSLEAFELYRQVRSVAVRRCLRMPLRAHYEQHATNSTLRECDPRRSGNFPTAHRAE